MTHFKDAMKLAQESLSLEARAKSIPLPKAKASAAKAAPKAKVKAKAKASPDAKPAAVPATRLKRFAHSAIVEAREAGTGVSPALQRAGRVTAENMQNCERDLHSLFWKCGLALPVRLSTMRFGLLYVHYISLSTWFRCLLGDYPHLLLGGFSDSSKASLLLESFWETYRVAHSDHFVFSQHPGNLKACVPYYLHLDEGTGLRKSAVLVFNFQAAFGQETAANFEKLFGEGTGRSDRDVKEYMVDAQTHNQRGSSFLSRFLFTVIPKKWYTKKFDFVYDRILAQLADEAARLACEGIRGMFPICLGLKGDAPALAKAAHYNRLKGADTMLLTRWLAVLIQRGLYRAESVWLDREKDAKPLAELCFDFVECYRDLATLCFERGHVKLGHIRIVGALVANLVLRPDTLKCGPFVRTDAALLLQQSLQVGVPDAPGILGVGTLRRIRLLSGAPPMGVMQLWSEGRSLDEPEEVDGRMAPEAPRGGCLISLISSRQRSQGASRHQAVVWSRTDETDRSECGFAAREGGALEKMKATAPRCSDSLPNTPDGTYQDDGVKKEPEWIILGLLGGGRSSSKKLSRDPASDRATEETPTAPMQLEALEDVRWDRERQEFLQQLQRAEAQPIRTFRIRTERICPSDGPVQRMVLAWGPEIRAIRRVLDLGFGADPPATPGTVLAHQILVILAEEDATSYDLPGWSQISGRLDALHSVLANHGARLLEGEAHLQALMEHLGWQAPQWPETPKVLSESALAPRMVSQWRPEPGLTFQRQLEELQRSHQAMQEMLRESKGSFNATLGDMKALWREVARLQQGQSEGPEQPPSAVSGESAILGDVHREVQSIKQLGSTYG
ncbi:Uncharacterized protein SCF082_LOCUS44382, partial [Durusdinium trenchii]